MSWTAYATVLCAENVAFGKGRGCGFHTADVVFDPHIWDASLVAALDASDQLSASPGRSTFTNGEHVNHVQHPQTKSLPYTHPVAGVQR